MSGFPDHPSVASALFNVGALAYEAGDDATARGQFERALAIWRKTLPPGDAKLARVEGLVAELAGAAPDVEQTPDVGAGAVD